MYLSLCPSKLVVMKVSDTRKAYRSWSPGHRTGKGKELNSSSGVVSNNRCCYDGDQCFQFLIRIKC